MIDLNVHWPGKSAAFSTAKTARTLGWSKIAFNIYYKLDKRGLERITPMYEGTSETQPGEGAHHDTDEASAVTTQLNDPLQGRTFHYRSDSNGEVTETCSFFKRASVLLLENFQPSSFNKLADSDEFDIIAAIPTDQRSFDSACDSLNCDLINLSAYCFRGAFNIRRGKITNAISRGCFFEVSLPIASIVEEFYVKQSASTGSGNPPDYEATYRSQLPSVLRHIPIKKLVISKGTSDFNDIDSPDKQVGMWSALISFVFGKSFSAVDCFSTAPKGCISKGVARRTYGTGIYVFAPNEMA